MGFKYALVHVKYTIPPTIILSLIYRPLLTKLDIYKIAFLITIAVVSTTPWDSYLIRNRVWTYPPNVIIGPKLFDIPAEGRVKMASSDTSASSKNRIGIT